MKCSYCGFDITEENAVFCPVCGTEVKKEVPRFCLGCGADVGNISGMFCPFCGTKLPPAETNAFSSQAAPGRVSEPGSDTTASGYASDDASATGAFGTNLILTIGCAVLAAILALKGMFGLLGLVFEFFKYFGYWDMMDIVFSFIPSAVVCVVYVAMAALLGIMGFTTHKAAYKHLFAGLCICGAVNLLIRFLCAVVWVLWQLIFWKSFYFGYFSSFGWMLLGMVAVLACTYGLLAAAQSASELPSLITPEGLADVRVQGPQEISFAARELFGNLKDKQQAYSAAAAARSAAAAAEREEKMAQAEANRVQAQAQAQAQAQTEAQHRAEAAQTLYGQGAQGYQGPYQGSQAPYGAPFSPLQPQGIPLGTERIKSDRSLLLYIILDIVTCNFYSWYFIYSLAKDINNMCVGDGKKTSGLGMFIVLNFFTCGLYSWIWMYSLGNRLAQNGPRYGMYIQENGTTILMWCIIGIILCGLGPFIAMYIIIKNTNAMDAAYNRANGLA